MTALIEWLGKADELSIEYDAGIAKKQLIQEGIDLGESLPAIIYPTSDNIRDIADAYWEKKIKKADRIDYMMALCSGTISGLIDTFYVGEFSLENANKWGSEEINKFVKRVSRLQGFKGDDLSNAIKYLENNYRLAADSVTPEFGGGLQHHLRDFSHHFSLGGLLCSLFTQFSGRVIGTDTVGALQIIELTDKTFIGSNFEEKVLFGTVNWFFHIVSDMSGSNATPGKGTGIPGPLVSLIKEVSVLPCFRDKKIGEHEFHKWVSKLFNGTLLARHDENGKTIETLRFDLRTEIGVLHEIGKQFVPVLINECLVRGLYFVRRLYKAIKRTEIHSFSDLARIDAAELLPVNNRVIRRMITIASGTYTAIDTVDAAVHAAIKSNGINPAFLINFAVRINIVGIGRFIIACMEDGKFITEDIRDAKARRDRYKTEFENSISCFKVLSMNPEQVRVLNSIKRLIIKDDIDITKDYEDILIKTQWETNWEKDILEGIAFLPHVEASSYFLCESDIVRFVNSCEIGPWLYLIAMEAMVFTPYYPLGKETNKKELSRLKFKGRYLNGRFISIQNKISKDDFSALQRAYKSALRIISGSNQRLIIGAVGTTAAMVVTGGIAFTFAPVIATTLAGEAAAGLSGAALVSYSLAAVGGGSLASGGLGIAGGTAIITGGGALIGMLSGTGISAAATINLLLDEGYVLNECCKLYAFSKEVLIKRFNDAIAVKEIQNKIESQINEVQKQIVIFTESMCEENDENRAEMKAKARMAQKSLKHLNRTSNSLKKLVSDALMEEL